MVMQWSHFKFPVMEGGLQNRDDKTMMRGILEPCSTCCNRGDWKCLELLGNQPTICTSPGADTRPPTHPPICQYKQGTHLIQRPTVHM